MTPIPPPNPPTESDKHHAKKQALWDMGIGEDSYRQLPKGVKAIIECECGDGKCPNCLENAIHVLADRLNFLENLKMETTANTHRIENLEEERRRSLFYRIPRKLRNIWYLVKWNNDLLLRLRGLSKCWECGVKVKKSGFNGQNECKNCNSYDPEDE